MSLKKSCSLWLAIYAVAAIFVGHIVYRRFPLIGAAVVGGVIGGGIVWLGLAFLGGVWQKIAEALRLRRTIEGGALPDDAKIAVVGTIDPLSATLASPFTGRPCVAYKYEVRAGNSLLYDGFALTPSAIFSQHGQIRILAYPDLQVTPRKIPSAEALPNFSEYIERTEFFEPSLSNLRESLKHGMAALSDDDGSIRTDSRMTRGDAPLERAAFTEWSLAPGDRVYATGHYSMQRGGLVPQPGMPLSLILRDAASGVPRPSFAGAIGNLIGAAIFFAIAAAGLLALYAFVPLAASEQMSPALRRTWREVRLERVLERRLRGRMRTAGLLDSGTVMAMLDAGTARGRVTTASSDAAVSRAAATRLGDLIVIRIDDGAVALTIDSQGRPLRLRFGNDDADASTFARDLDVEITESSASDVAGRFTYFRDDAETPACRVTFHAAVR